MSIPTAYIRLTIAISATILLAAIIIALIYTPPLQHFPTNDLNFSIGPNPAYLQNQPSSFDLLNISSDYYLCSPDYPSCYRIKILDGDLTQTPNQENQ